MEFVQNLGTWQKVAYEMSGKGANLDKKVVSGDGVVVTCNLVESIIKYDK
jgi:hypothetical protein